MRIGLKMRASTRLCFLIADGRQCVWEHKLPEGKLTAGMAVCRAVGFGVKQQEEIHETKEAILTGGEVKMGSLCEAAVQRGTKMQKSLCKSHALWQP